MRYIPFSQRSGYVKPENIFIREQLSGSVLNSVLNSTSDLMQQLAGVRDFDFFTRLTSEFQLKYLNLRYDQMYKSNDPFAFIEDETNEWYYRLDVIEWVIAHLRYYISEQFQENKILASQIANVEKILDDYIASLNQEFDRLNYGYRIIDDVFIETTASSEIAVIQESLGNADANSVTHIQECLRLLSPSNKELSTRNGIKEAISAVEVTARRITNTNTLDEAFKRLREIHPMIKLSMEKLYHYTNQKDTGIRHGWMEQSDEPTINEAIFVLVSSCSFINYLNKVYCNSEHQ